MHLDHVAGRAGDRRHDRGLAPRDPVEQASTCRRSAAPRSRPPARRAAARRAPRRPAPAAISSRSCCDDAQAPARPGPPARRPRRKNRCAPRPAPAPRSAGRASVSARSPSSPLSWRYACRRCASVSAAIRSARPSTAVRSSRPFSNARRVNSPASAGRKPVDRARAPPAPRRSPRGRRAGAARPCPRRSRCSAPETTAASASSITSPLAGSRTRGAAPRARGSGRRPISACERLAGARARDAHHRDRRRRPAGGEGEDGVAGSRHSPSM